MPRIHTMIAALFALIPLGLVFLPNVARAEKRIALVIGNAGYQAGALNTPANDAGLIAQTLQAAGFDAVGARDLDQDSLRRAFRDFLEKATNAGPDTVAVIYTGGYGVQLEGENYFVPIDAKIARDADVAAQALRISDYTRPLAALKLKATIVVLDAARANPFARSGPPLAGGLALVEPEPGLLMAFNAAPGTVAPEGPGPYGPYAQALAEMLREGGLPLPQVFDRTRLRVNDMTRGAQVPWQASKVDASLLFFERAADAPPPAVAAGGAQAMRARPMRELPVADAYAAALDRDTLDGYADFIDAYPGDPMARRVRAIIAARREAMTWRRTRAVDTPPAYWSYLRRYPQGPHAPDAHRRLAFLAAVLEPPPSFAMLAYDLPPPPPEEIVYIRRPVLVFDDPVFAFAPPPPPSVVFLAPPPAEFVVLAPPPPPVGLFLLPIPVYRPVPVWVRPPAYVAPPPPNNVIYTNVHNTVVVNNVTNTVTITNSSGQTQTVTPAAQPATQAGAPAAATPAPAAPGPALPPSVAQKAATLQGAGTAPGAPAPAPTVQPLPGAAGRPLPAPTTPSAALSPGTPPSAPALGGAKPGTSPTAPGVKTPSAVVTPVTPPSSANRGAPPAATAPTTPPAAGTPTTPTATAPAAKTPAAAVTPGTPSSPSGTKPGAPPSPAPTVHAPATTAPSAKPVSPPPAVTRVTPQSPPAAKPVAPSPPAAAPPPPAAKLTPPPPPAKPATPPPPAAAKPVAPPASAAAEMRPAPPPAAPKIVHPQPKGCPVGKSMAVVNGHPVCK
jgi:uncharacterized caspase-like protein